MFAISHNTEGYLPDVPEDTILVDTLEEARSVLADEIERAWDAEYNYAETAEDRLAVDARYVDAHTSVNSVEPGEYVSVENGSPHGLATIYHIDIVTDEEK